MTKKTAKKHVDKIKDFGGKYDKIFFDDSAFSNKLLKKLGTKAKSKNDLFLMDKRKKKLLFDADGSGSKFKAVLIATYTEAKKEGHISASDFFLV